MKQGEALISLGVLVAIGAVMVLGQHGGGASSGGGGQAPAVPTGLAASSVTSTSFTFSWNPSMGAATYLPTVDGGPATNGGIAQTSILFDHLTPGSSFALTVEAFNPAGIGSGPSAVLTVTLPLH